MMTGEEYRASLDDGRETYFEGRRVDNVATDPILGITVDSAAAGYDRFYDPTPGAVGAFMKVPGSTAELREQVFPCWSLGTRRSPEYLGPIRITRHRRPLSPPAGRGEMVVG